MSRINAFGADMDYSPWRLKDDLVMAMRDGGRWLSQSEQTCVHEGVHAAAAVALGLRVEYATDWSDAAEYSVATGGAGVWHDNTQADQFAVCLLAPLKFFARYLPDLDAGAGSDVMIARSLVGTGPRFDHLAAEAQRLTDDVGFGRAVMALARGMLANGKHLREAEILYLSRKAELEPFALRQRPAAVPSALRTVRASASRHGGVSGAEMRARLKAGTLPAEVAQVVRKVYGLMGGGAS